jgi:hypothetical protein
MDRELLTIFNAYGYERVKKCFLGLHKDFISRRKKYNDEARAAEEAILAEEDGWIEFDPSIDPRKPGEEWRVLDNRYFKRKFEQTRYHGGSNDSGISEAVDIAKPKADLSMQPTDKICIECGGTLAYEPICPGCRLGRLGFKGRFVCMEDMDHEFYVLREGIILPNQGD